MTDINRYNETAPDCRNPGCSNQAFWSGTGPFPKFCGSVCRRAAKSPGYSPIGVCGSCGAEFRRPTMGRGSVKAYCSEGCRALGTAAKKKAANRRYYERGQRLARSAETAGVEYDSLVSVASAELVPLFITFDNSAVGSRSHIESSSSILRIVDSGKYDLIWPVAVDRLSDVSAKLKRALSDADREALLADAINEIDPVLSTMDVSPKSAGEYLQIALALANGKYAALWPNGATSLTDLDVVLLPG